MICPLKFSGRLRDFQNSCSAERKIKTKTSSPDLAGLPQDQETRRLLEFKIIELIKN